ncbi:MAG: hypothetical protein AB7P00_30295 [Sandaracinaceae bacterium]
MTTRTSVAVLLLTLSSGFGCDGASMTADDAGPPGSDAGRADAGRRDAGPPDPTDAGTDAGPPLGPRSVITLLLRTGPITVDALDEDGAPLVLSTGYGTDDGEIHFVSDSTLYRFDRAMRRLVEPQPLLSNDESSQIAIDLMVDGVIGGAQIVLGIDGTDAFLWQSAPATGNPRFGAPVSFQQKATMSSPAMPFTPPAVAIASLDNLAFFPVAISEDGTSFMLEATAGSFTYLPLPGGILICDSAVALTPELMTQGVLPGAPAATEPTLLLIDGDTVYPRRANDVCFEEGIQLLDEASSVIDAPTIAFAVNFDASIDHSKEVLVVVEDAP